MNKRTVVVMMAVLLCAATAVPADDFGTGANLFTIDFVTISGGTNPAGGVPAGNGFTFVGVNHDYRIGVYEITNDQWDKFTASLSVPVTGNPSSAYDASAHYTGTNVPTNNVSWYEAAQFVNWLNTSTGYQAAYNFTGTQGAGDYTFATWSPAEAAGGTNLYRHKNAMYYLPTENEWLKAAYWNGTAVQTYATKNDALPVAGVDSNYNSAVGQPWDVGSSSEELNGTFNMMGNVLEWMENPTNDPSYGPHSARGLRQGLFCNYDYYLVSSAPLYYSDVAYSEQHYMGFRVASQIPEPGTLGLLALGGLAVLRRRWNTCKIAPQTGAGGLVASSGRARRSSLLAAFGGGIDVNPRRGNGGPGKLRLHQYRRHHWAVRLSWHSRNQQFRHGRLPCGPVHR